MTCNSSLYILAPNPLSDTSFVNLFSHSLSCLFTFLMITFASCGLNPMYYSGGGKGGKKPNPCGGGERDFSNRGGDFVH